MLTIGSNILELINSCKYPLDRLLLALLPTPPLVGANFKAAEPLHQTKPSSVFISYFFTTFLPITELNLIITESTNTTPTATISSAAALNNLTFRGRHYPVHLHFHNGLSPNYSHQL